jgi:hypothetical protein
MKVAQAQSMRQGAIVADQEDRQAVKKVNPVIEAINTISRKTEAGRCLFYLAKEPLFFPDKYGCWRPAVAMK